jgi:uncharacterized membrane protein
MEMVNLAGEVFSKQGSSIKTFGLAAFYNTTDSLSDPKVLFDAPTGRWFTSIIDVSLFNVILAVSTTNDPTGTWKLYTISAGTNLPDQPIIGINDDKFVVSANDFQGGSVFVGAQYWVLNKSEMLAGASSIDFASFGPDGTLASVHPVQSLSPTTTQYMVSTGFGATSVSQLFSLTGVPPGTVSVNLVSLSVSPISTPPNGVEPGGSVDIQRSAGRVMDAAWFQGSLWYGLDDACTPSGDTQVRSCLRLTQIDTTATSVKQDFDFSTSGRYYFYPALRIDSTGSVDIIFGFSSSTIYPSLAITGQVLGDPVGSLAPPLTIVNGTAANTSGRYGDYFGAGIDPSDTSLTWVAGEYGSTTGGVWNTFIADMRLGAGFTISAKPSSVTFPATSSATSTISLTSFGNFTGAVNLSTIVSSSGLTASLSPTSVSLTPGATATSTLTASSSTPGTYTITVTGRSSSGISHSTVVTVSVIGFGISAASPIVAIPVGSSGRSDVTLNSINGFSGSVGLGTSISPSISNGPTISLSPTTVTLSSGGSATSALTISTTHKTATGLYTINITGTSGPESHSTIVSAATTPITFNISNTTTFTGVTVTTTGSLSLDSPSNTFTVSGSATVSAANATTGATLFSKTYTVTSLPLTGSSGSFQTIFLLDVAVNPYPLSSNNVLTLSNGAAPSIAVGVSRNIDIDGDGLVDMTDVNIISASFGCSIGQACYNPRADLNADGTVNIIDLALLARYFGATDFITNFSVSASPTKLTTPEGSSSTSTITLTSLQGFAGTITLTSTVSSSGLSASLSPTSVTLSSGGTATSTLTVSVSSSTPAGTYTVTVSGTTTIYGLTVTHAAVVTISVPPPDFSISASPTSLTIGIGASATSTITLTSLNGFQGTVTLQAAVSNATVSNRPTTSFNPPSVVLSAGGTGTSTLTISTTSSTPTGSYTVTARGTSGRTLAHSTTISVTVSVVPDFNMSANTTTLAVPFGSSGTVIVNMTSLNGFSGSVSLSATVSPSATNGPTISFKPTKVTLKVGGSATSTITISTTSTTPTGLYTVTVTGTSGSLTHSVAIAIAITPITFSINNSTTFTGVTVQTKGALSVDSPSNSFTVSGTATVTATNSTTGSILFTKTYAIAKLAMSGSPGSFRVMFLLNVAVNPYPLSSNIILTMTSGSPPSINVGATRNIDVDGNGAVDMTDLNIISASFGCSIGQSCYNPRADLDADGTVNIIDLSIAALWFGSRDFI